jgi:signal transduction histidine kinase
LCLEQTGGLEQDAAALDQVSEGVLRPINERTVQRERGRTEEEVRCEQWQAAEAELKKEVRRVLAEAELLQAQSFKGDEQEAERRRAAWRLHDLGQTLTLLQVGLHELGQKLAPHRDLQCKLASLEEIAGSAVSEVNRLPWQNRPAALDDLGLETAIQHLIETLSERLDLQFGLHLALNGRRLDPEVETTLYRVLQEAIINIIRHAEATRVGVLLEASDKEVRMIVDDDGRGFPPIDAGSAEMPAKRLGILGMRERLALVSGTLEVESAPGRGCLLFARVPL